MNRASRLLSLALFMLSGPVFAADREGNFAIKGVGLAPCADFLEASIANDERLPMFYGWISGFLSAMNLHGENTYDLVDWQSDTYISESLTRWCADNREERFFSGVYQMARSLEAFKVSSRSPIVVMDGPEGRIRLYRATLDRVRETLTGEGLLDERRDGDEALAIALRAFQRRESLPETGMPDTTTLFRLFARK